MAWALPLLFASFLLLNCSDTRQAADQQLLTDSLVLFKKDSAFTAGEIPALIKCTQITPVNKGHNSKILLILDQPILTAPAEGVFEVYVTSAQQEIALLSAEQKSFTGLLDLYSLTAPGARQQLELDITEKISPLLLKHHTTVPVFYIYVRLAPVQDASEKNSPKRSALHFNNAAIVQVKIK